MAEQIEHIGYVDRIQGYTVYVKILSVSACGSCKARQACGLAETQEKIVEVHTSEANTFTAGERVLVGVRRTAGAWAVLLAYVGALIVLLTTLSVTIAGLEWTEGQGALASLAGVALYYVILWLVRNKIEHTIHFTITKN